MDELVESVKQEGILTALLVRPMKKGGYEIIAGHRRKRAAQLAGLDRVPVVIRELLAVLVPKMLEKAEMTVQDRCIGLSGSLIS